MFCSPVHAFDCTMGVESRFSFFALPNSFSVVSRSSGPVFMFWAVLGPVVMFCTPFWVVQRALGPVFIFYTLGLILGGIWVSGPVFMFYATGPILDYIEGVRSCFHVLRCRTCFGRYRVRRVKFSCFALSGPFWAVSRASGQVMTFCAPGRVFDGNEGVRSSFHVLRSRTHFRRYRECHVLFSSFVLPDSF
jgi:hypothetical protein